MECFCEPHTSANQAKIIDHYLDMYRLRYKVDYFITQNSTYNYKEIGQLRKLCSTNNIAIDDVCSHMLIFRNAVNLVAQVFHLGSKCKISCTIASGFR